MWSVERKEIIDMAIKFKGLGHVALRCREENLKKLEAFFEETLGFKKAFDLINEHGEIWITYYRVGQGQYIEIIPGIPSDPVDYYDGTKNRNRHSYYHACFEISDRFAAVQDLEETKGLPVGRAMDDSVGLCKSHCMFVTDPEGGEWELMEFTPKSLQIVNEKER